MKAVKAVGGVAAAALAAALAFTLLDTGEGPTKSVDARVAELTAANAALTKQVSDLRIAVGASQAAQPAPCAECAKREATALAAAATAPKAPAEAKSAAPPKSLKEWLALAANGALPKGFKNWLAAHPERLLEAVAALDTITDPELSQALVDIIKRTRGALKDSLLQKALLELTTEAKTPEGKAQALELLAEAFKRDALASARLSPSERQGLADLALSGAPEVRKSAVDALIHMPDDPASVAAFARVWNDPSLPMPARKQAVVGLRFAPQDVALPILLESLSSQTPLPVQLRQQAAVSLTYLNPQSEGAQVFERLAPTLAAEPDWIAKGFTFVALMQIDHQRAHSLLRDLQLAERDPWEAEKYAALAEIASRESDYQRIVWQGIRAYRQIEARREQQAD